MTKDTVTLEFTLQQFNKLKANLKASVANDGYFPYRQLRDMPVASLAKNIKVELTPEQFTGIKNALARLTVIEAETSLDIVFDVGEPQMFEIMQARQEQANASMQAAAAQATGLPDLKEVKLSDVKKARKKPTKAKRKVG